MKSYYQLPFGKERQKRGAQANPLIVQWLGISLSAEQPVDQSPVVLVRDLVSFCLWVCDCLPEIKKKVDKELVVNFKLCYFRFFTKLGHKSFRKCQAASEFFVLK